MDSPRPFFLAFLPIAGVAAATVLAGVVAQAVFGGSVVAWSAVGLLVGLAAAGLVGAALARRTAALEASRATLEERLGARSRELREALEQQAATSEVLEVISRSRTDLQPVFDAIARSAMRLCRASQGAVFRYDAGLIHLAAVQGLPPEGVENLRRRYPVVPGDSSLTARAIRDRRVINVANVLTEPDIPENTRAQARIVGSRSQLVVPMLRDGEPVGCIGIVREEPGPFSETQVQLLTTFAHQAVIAIENARLFQELEARNRELTDALEQQTATAEILRVISSSPTDVQPVFDTIVRSAAVLCGAQYGSAVRFDGELMHLAAGYNYTPEVGRALRQAFPMRPHPRMMAGRAILSRSVVQVEDALHDLEYAQDVARAGGFRSMLAVPMLRDASPIGAIVVNRDRPGAFSPAQIELLKTFAAQAVIAVENVRLFQELEARNRELTEALEQQTATAAILEVISSSPTDIQPVLDAIAETATRLCDAGDVSIALVEGNVLRVVASHGQLPRWWPDEGVPISRGSVTGRSVVDRRTVHIHDLASESAEEFPQGKVYQRLGGIRTNLAVPLLREGVVIGVIAMRRGEVRPFTDQQVKLLETFAAQAVIAIENVRLFQELDTRNHELTQALARESATGEILGVINRSPTDVAPAFQAILSHGLRLCGADLGLLFLVEGETCSLVAEQGAHPAFVDKRRAGYRFHPDTALSRCLRERHPVHLPDAMADDAYLRQVPDRLETVELLGARSGVWVPMLRGDEAVGALVVWRREVRPFAESDIEVLTTFAAQAVIALENSRLFQALQSRNRQLTEALEQQTATAQILRVISISPTNVQPVFDTIAASAKRLCEAASGAVLQFDGSLIHLSAYVGSAEELEAIREVFPIPPGRGSVTARAILTQAVVHVNIAEDPEYQHRGVLRGALPTVLSVPMLRDGNPIGAITVTRGEGRPFSDTQIALIRTFADQAVIAIENVRLFQELEARTRDLAQSVDEMQALAEVGQAVSSTLDLQTVLTTIVVRAVELSRADGGAIYEFDEAAQAFLLRATHGMSEALVAAIREARIGLGETVVGRSAARRSPEQVPDILEEPGSPLRDAVVREGLRALLSVPLLGEERIVGALVVRRRAPGAFPEETVRVLQAFATQSVLAIQNARLFRELEDKGRELEVASRHKSQFLANMSHELRTPLNAILGYTELILDGIYGEAPAKIREVMERVDRSGRHLLGLINDVLDLSKIEAGQLTLALADYSLKEVVETVATAVEALAADKRLALEIAVAPDLPPGRGDERRLAQVLLNLVGNALKFTETGEVRVTAKAADGRFVVAVSDTGTGIADADRERIFEEFQQADSSATRKKGGTGLGLSIARRIVELHGGRLWVESTVGQGSTFSFTVPVRVERQAAR